MTRIKAYVCWNNSDINDIKRAERKKAVYENRGFTFIGTLIDGDFCRSLYRKKEGMNLHREYDIFYAEYSNRVKSNKQHSKTSYHEIKM
jgi:hypothetical protein